MNQQIKYLSVVETAKLVRAVLKEAFPGIKFSVRSKSYSGGASIDVDYLNGPTAKEVEKVTKQFQGGGFDGMIDMAYNWSSWLLPDGSAIVARDPGTHGSRGTYPERDNAKPHPKAQLVQFGADYVFVERKYTEEVLRNIAQVVSKEYGVEVPKITVWDFEGGSAHLTDFNPQWVKGTNNSIGELIYKRIREMSFYVKPNNSEVPANGEIRIVENHEMNGIEIYFPEKPSQEVIDKLKSYGWRWHGKKRCWYSGDTESNRIVANEIKEGN